MWQTMRRVADEEGVDALFLTGHLPPPCYHTDLFARLETRQVRDQKNSYGDFILKISVFCFTYYKIG